MTWTYNLALLATADPLTTVRMLTGDNITSDQQLQDEEINAQITINGGILMSAAACAESIGARYTRQADSSAGDLRVSKSQRAKAYMAMADSLRLQARTQGFTPYAGGISVSDKQSREDDTNRVAPAFSVGMMTNPGVLASTDDVDEDS